MAYCQPHPSQSRSISGKFSPDTKGHLRNLVSQVLEQTPSLAAHIYTLTPTLSCRIYGLDTLRDLPDSKGSMMRVC